MTLQDLYDVVKNKRTLRFELSISNESVKETKYLASNYKLHSDETETKSKA